MLAARPDERARLEATIDERFDWESAAAAIAACVDGGDADALARALRRCACAPSCTRLRATSPDAPISRKSAQR
jgi:hypothetical protein